MVIIIIIIRIVYVPFNASAGDTTKELKFTLANRVLNPSLVDPDWTVLVTQLECANGGRRVALKRELDHDNLDAEESFVNELMDSGRAGREISATDAYLVAPVGCLQYFPDPSGVIESFNFNNGNGVYMGNMKYSICFRKTSKNQQLV